MASVLLVAAAAVLRLRSPPLSCTSGNACFYLRPGKNPGDSVAGDCGPRYAFSHADPVGEWRSASSGSERWKPQVLTPNDLYWPINERPRWENKKGTFILLYKENEFSRSCCCQDGLPRAGRWNSLPGGQS